MRRAMLLLSVLSLLAMTIGCGGGDSSTRHVGTSQVTITVEDSGRSASITTEKGSLLAMAERLFMVITGSGIAVAAIPWDVTHILFTISAPDMVTITRNAPVAGRSSITETFMVPNGKNRCFLVQAQNASGNTLYRPAHEICRNLDGEPVTLTVDMQDYAPPSFEGLHYAYPVSATEIDLYWRSAYDYYTPAEDFVYQIYREETSGEENFASPTYTTDPGVTFFSVTGLQPETTYFFVVRATDNSGNQDSNSVEISATTPQPPDITPPAFEGLVSATYNSENESMVLSWEPASDNRTGPENIVYLIYMATTSGGQNFADPNFTTNPGETSFSVAGLVPGTYYFVVRARDQAGNMDTNTVEELVDTGPPTILSVTPADGSQGVATRPVITVNFSEPMNPDTITADSFRLYESWEGEGAFVEGTVGYSGTTATFTPSRNLRSYRFYSATVTLGVTDLAGNHMGEEYNWVFTIEDEPPRIVSVYPGNETYGSGPRPVITVNFSEPMDPTSITSTSFRLINVISVMVPPPVEGTLAYSGTTATFMPLQDLNVGWYTATVTTEVTDLAGNHMLVDYSWLFATYEEE